MYFAGGSFGLVVDDADGLVESVGLLVGPFLRGLDDHEVGRLLFALVVLETHIVLLGVALGHFVLTVERVDPHVLVHVVQNRHDHVRHDLLGLALLQVVDHDEHQLVRAQQYVLKTTHRGVHLRPQMLRERVPEVWRLRCCQLQH